jgi:hypothetical protein
VTQDNNEKVLTGSLTEFNRTTHAIQSSTFTKTQLRQGVPVTLAVNCSYHFEILKAPAAGMVTVTVTRPTGPPVPNQCTGKFLGPWIIRAN